MTMRAYLPQSDLPALQAFYARLSDRSGHCPSPEQMAGFLAENELPSFPNENIVMVWEDEPAQFYGLACLDRDSSLRFSFEPGRLRGEEEGALFARVAALVDERRFDHFGFRLDVFCSVAASQTEAIAGLR